MIEPALARTVDFALDKVFQALIQWAHIRDVSGWREEGAKPSRSRRCE